MKRCVKIVMNFDGSSDSLRNFIQKKAVSSQIEGSVQALEDNKIRIIACGDSATLDSFIDELYRGYKKAYPQGVTVEPFLTTADYRGVFRIIE
ncbi:MAG TPA: acylphosphatase [Candidatus Babeliales bacterium]|nr:acylphosphatase [Candidatus Babeliales bacterium]